MSIDKEFKELTNDLLVQGWRCYHVSDIDSLKRGAMLRTLAIRFHLNIQVYEGKSLVFVKTIFIPKQKKRKQYEILLDKR